MIEVEANILVANRFLNLEIAVPSEYVLSSAGVMSVTVDEPDTDSVPCRVVEPDTVRSVIVVVARVEVPLIVNVPVACIFPPMFVFPLIF